MKTFLSFLFGCFISTQVLAQSTVSVKGVSLSQQTKDAVANWMAEVPQLPDAPSLTILLKEGDSGRFAESEWRPWWDFYHDEDQPPPNWLEDKHGAQIVWTDESSVGCMVHVPRTESYSFQYGNLPPEWVLNHELSHCLWVYREQGKWWSDSKDRSIFTKELAYLEEEEWADLWALMLAQKQNKISPDTAKKWLKNRTKEALNCKCIDHWTNLPLAIAIETPASKKTNLWKLSHNIMRQSYLKKTDVMALKWYWTTQDKEYLTNTSNMWLNKKSSSLELDL